MEFVLLMEYKWEKIIKVEMWIWIKWFKWLDFGRKDFHEWWDRDSWNWMN